jgi:VWFA-related protein
MTRWLAVTLSTLIAAPLVAQAPTVADQITVDLVNVEVHVVGRDRRPVAGLAREEFRLFDGDREVPITHFAWIPQRPAGDAAGRRGAEPVEPRQVALFFDELQVGEHNRRPLLDALRDQLARGLAEGDRVSVVRFDGANFDVLLDASTDRRRLARVLDDLDSFSLGQLVATQELRQGIALVGQTIQHEKQTCVGAEEAVRTYMNLARRQVEASAGALLRYAQRLGAAPGRRVLLHLSGGVPMTAGLEVFEWAAEMCDVTAKLNAVPDAELGHAEYGNATGFVESAGRWNPRATRGELPGYSNLALWRDVTARVNALGITVYPILFGDVEGRFHTEMQGLSTMTSSAAFTARHNSRDTLSLLADATGGLMIDAERATAEQLARMLDDLGGYYSLAFTPDAGAGTGLRPIRVEVGRDDVALRHRDAYRLQSRDERIALQLATAFEIERLENPLQVSLELQPAADAAATPRLRLVVPFEPLALVASPGGGEEGRFTVYIALRRDNGRLLMPRHRAIVARRAEPTAAAYTYDVELPAEPASEVAVAVADDFSGAVAFARQRLRPR